MCSAEELGSGGTTEEDIDELVVAQAGNDFAWDERISVIPRTGTMSQDEIIREVRSLREAYAERFGFDIRALYEDAKRHEGEAGRKVVSLEPRIIHRPVTEK